MNLLLKNKMTVAIVVASDKGAAGERQDRSGKEIERIVTEKGYEIVSYAVLSDDFEVLRDELLRLCDEVKVDLVLTTGGTGLSPRDNTPEATLSVAHKEVPGISEAMRSYSMTITKRAMLSRGVSVIRNSTLIINLPGSPKAVCESLEYIIDELEHGIGIMKGTTGECARK